MSAVVEIYEMLKSFEKHSKVLRTLNNAELLSAAKATVGVEQMPEFAEQCNRVSVGLMQLSQAIDAVVNEQNAK